MSVNYTPPPYPAFAPATRTYHLSHEGRMLINAYDDVATALDWVAMGIGSARDIAAKKIRALRKKLPVTVLAVIPLEEE